MINRETVVWITGSSSGIGKALAYALSSKNCKLILSGRNEAALYKVKSNCNADNVFVLPFDLLAFDNAKENVEKQLLFLEKLIF